MKEHIDYCKYTCDRCGTSMNLAGDDAFRASNWRTITRPYTSRTSACNCHLCELCFDLWEVAQAKFWNKVIP